MTERRMRRPRAWSLVRRLALWAVAGLALLVASGLLLADHLTPRATGAPGHALALEPGATAIDRELAPLLDAHPGETGVLIVPDGTDAFAMRALATRRAGRSLDLQYYIWHDDLTGRLLAREVHAAAQRGVRVRLLLDDMNAEGLDRHLLALDAHPDIEVRLYNPFRNREGAWRIVEMLQRAFRVTHRMHNKAWIVDGRVAVVGGRNIGDEYFTASDDVNFRDLDLLLFGPAVGQASAIFDRLWNSRAAVPVAALHARDPAALAALVASAGHGDAERGAEPYLDRVARSANVRGYFAETLSPIWTRGVRVISDPPLKTEANRSRWLVGPLVDMLGRSTRKALLVSPYFVPGDAGVALMSGLASRGVFVGIATNSLAANDVPAVHAGYARYRDALLARGVRLYEVRTTPHAGLGYGRRASLHTKAMTIDDRSGFVGSFNLDPRSINLNTEMGVAFDDARIARRVRDEFLRLSAPASSYWVFRTAEGDLRWLDRTPPARVLDDEPDAAWPRRLRTKAVSLLPMESQL